MQWISDFTAPLSLPFLAILCSEVVAQLIRFLAAYKMASLAGVWASVSACMSFHVLNSFLPVLERFGNPYSTCVLKRFP